MKAFKKGDFVKITREMTLDEQNEIGFNWIDQMDELINKRLIIDRDVQDHSQIVVLTSEDENEEYDVWYVHIDAVVLADSPKELVLKYKKIIGE